MTLRPNADSGSIWSLPFALLLLSGFAGYLSFYLTLPVLPTYLQQLGGSESLIGLIIGIFSLVALLVRPWSGFLADRFGSRTVLLLGVAGLLAAAVAYLPARSIEAVFAARVIHGLGWGLFTAAVATMAAQLAPPNRRGAVLGLAGLSASAGMAIGPAIGTAMGPGRMVFGVSVGLAALGLILTTLLPRVGQVQQGRQPRLSDLINREALLPSSVFLAHMATYGAVVSFMPLFMAERGLGNSGWFFTTYAASLFVFRGFSGHLSDRYGRLPVIGPGLLLSTVALLLLTMARSHVGLMAAAFLYAGAMSLIQPTVQAWATDRAAVTQRGSALATVIATQDLGISLGSSAAGVVAGWTGVSSVFLVAALLSLAGLLPLALASRSQKRAGPPSVNHGAADD